MTPDRNNESGKNAHNGLFMTTHWSIIQRAQENSTTALNSLFKSYRSPLLIWLRARQFSPHDAEDVVHGFFASLLRRNFLQEINREKGKFRNFLLASLKNYLNDERDKALAIRRGAGEIPASLQQVNEKGQPVHDPASPNSTPDLEYDRAWARAALANSLKQLEAECARTGHAALCEALEPVMFADETAFSYREIGMSIGMSEGAVKVAAYRIRARLRGVIREVILETVDNEEDLEDELRYLASLFARPEVPGT